MTRILRRAGLPRLAECDPLSVVHRRENAALRGDGHADVGVRILAGAVSAGHTQVPGLRPALHVLNGEFARVSLASLLEQGQRVVGRDEHHRLTGTEGVQRPKDGAVADGVRDGAGVQHRVGVIVLGAAASRADWAEGKGVALANE